MTGTSLTILTGVSIKMEVDAGLSTEKPTIVIVKLVDPSCLGCIYIELWMHAGGC